MWGKVFVCLFVYRGSHPGVCGSFECMCVFLRDHVFSFYQIPQGLHDLKKMNNYCYRVMRSLLWPVSSSEGESHGRRAEGEVSAAPGI